jgi:hypothetical protein
MVHAPAEVDAVLDLTGPGRPWHISTVPATMRALASCIPTKAGSSSVPRPYAGSAVAGSADARLTLAM